MESALIGRINFDAWTNSREKTLIDWWNLLYDFNEILQLLSITWIFSSFAKKNYLENYIQSAESQWFHNFKTSSNPVVWRCKRNAPEKFQHHNQIAVWNQKLQHDWQVKTNDANGNFSTCWDVEIGSITDRSAFALNEKLHDVGFKFANLRVSLVTFHSHIWENLKFKLKQILTFHLFQHKTAEIG